MTSWIYKQNKKIFMYHVILNDWRGIAKNILHKDNSEEKTGL